MTAESWILAAGVALVISAALYGVLQGLLGNAPRRSSIGGAIGSLYEPGGFFYERNEAVRRLMARRGLSFQYWTYRSPSGRSVTFPGEQLKHLGGPFRFLVSSLQEVYAGAVEGNRVTIGHVVTGDVDDREERMAAIVSVRGTSVPAFVAAPHRFARGGEPLWVPSHPQLAKTHRVLGDAAPLLSGALLDVLTRDDGWALEGKDHALVIYRTAPQRESSGFLSVDEIGRFVEDALAIAGLLTAATRRVSS